ncbi:MAG: RlmE family RNA methyltransferase [Pseudomonadota bacterium]
MMAAGGGGKRGGSGGRGKGPGGAGKGRTGPVAGASGRGQRELRQKVKTAKGRRLSSTRWLERQLNDPYVRRAQAEGFRGRAAYKLAEIDDKLRFLVPGARVVDLGCAPGGWCQVAVARVNADGARKDKKQGFVLGVDLQEVEPIPGVTLMQRDFLDEGADEAVRAALNGPADAVLSDMAASASGHRATDHLKIMALAEAAAEFAFDVLEEGGSFVAKVLQGGTEGALLAALKQRFAKVAHIKPPASRKDSTEIYVVATGFRGAAAEEDG